MLLLQYALDKYSLTIDNLPDDLKTLVKGFQKVSNEAKTESQKAQLGEAEKVIVRRIVEYGTAVSAFSEENTPPQYSEPTGESVTLKLNGGEPYPAFKGKFYWVGLIKGASDKYQFERDFVSDRKDEGNKQYSNSAVLHEGKYYEVKDGYDNYFATVEGGAIKKLTKEAVVEMFNAPKREPRTSTPRTAKTHPSVSEQKTDIPFAQYLAIVEYFQNFRERKASERRYEKDFQNPEAFIDTSEGDIYLKLTYKIQNGLGEWHDKVDWTCVGKGGKERYYDPDAVKTEFYEFETGKNKFYGFPTTKLSSRSSVAKKEGWYLPCKDDGYLISFVNNKIVESNAKRLKELGYEVESSNSYSFSRFVIFKDKMPAVAKRVGVPDLKPIVLPSRMRVPDDRREPHYKKLDSSTKINSLIMKQEVLLGKLEAARYKYYDSMYEYDVFTKESELTWEIPKTKPQGAWHNKIWVENNGRITIGDYYLRYNGKKGKAYVSISENGEGEPSSSSTAKTVSEPKKNDDNATAQKFYKTAEALRKKGKEKHDSLDNALTNTPRRRYDYNFAVIKADILLEKAQMYEAIGKAYENGTLPDILRGISPAQSDNHFDEFVFGRDSSGYSISRSNKRNFERYAPHKQAENAKKWAALEQLLGGKSAKSEAEQKADLIKQKIEAVRFAKIDGFFPTPKSIIDKMLQYAKIQDSDTVLEPSAGIGSIADAVREAHPSVKMDVCESQYSLREILKLQGHNIVGDDTLKLTGKYDVIVMNPPFENGQDVDHIRYCYDNLLKPGGKLVAIMSRSYTYNSKKKFADFRQFLRDVDNENCYVESLPEGAFNDPREAFRQTGVNTNLVVLEKSKSKTPPSVSKPKIDRKALILDLKMALKYSIGSEATKISTLIQDLELAEKYA